MWVPTALGVDLQKSREHNQKQTYHEINIKYILFRNSTNRLEGRSGNYLGLGP